MYFSFDGHQQLMKFKNETYFLHALLKGHSIVTVGTFLHFLNELNRVEK